MQNNVLIIPGADYSTNKVRKINLDVNTPIIEVASDYVSMSSVDNLPIYYTTDGSIPTNESNLYTSPLLLSSNIIIRAVCFNSEDLLYSDVATYYAVAPIFERDNITFSGTGQNILSPVLDYNSDYTILYDFTPSSLADAAGFFSSPIARIWYGLAFLRLSDPGHTINNESIRITDTNIINVRVRIVLTSHNGKIRYKAKIGDSYTEFKEFNNVEATETKKVCNIGLFAWYHDDLNSRAAKGTLHSVQIYSTAFSDEQMTNLLG